MPSNGIESNDGQSLRIHRTYAAVRVLPMLHSGSLRTLAILDSAFLDLAFAGIPLPSRSDVLSASRNKAANRDPVAVRKHIQVLPCVFSLGRRYTS